MESKCGLCGTCSVLNKSFADGYYRHLIIRHEWMVIDGIIVQFITLRWLTNEMDVFLFIVWSWLPVRPGNHNFHEIIETGPNIEYI